MSAVRFDPSTVKLDEEELEPTEIFPNEDKETVETAMFALAPEVDVTAILSILTFGREPVDPPDPLWK
ncbi:MAG: hypothetical protein ACOYNS_13970 [Bacteroidota bacterium]